MSNAAATNRKRLYPAYTLIELESAIKEGNRDEVTANKMKLEVEARKAGAKSESTPQVSWSELSVAF